MRLFRRIGDIIAANLNELADRFEDPEVMLKQAIREMETMIENATGAAARAIAGERMLARDLSDHERDVQRWNDRAEQAVVHGDDDLASQAIARAHEHEAMARALVDQRSSSERTALALRAQINAMRAKHCRGRKEARQPFGHASDCRKRPRRSGDDR
jgi:phage shock protein A